MNRFEGKRILITGGTSGMGFAAAKMIVEEGGEVAVTGMSQDHLNEAGRTLPPTSLVLRNDASDPAAADELAEKVANMGGVDGLWLNAGYAKFGPNSENSAEMFDDMFNTNVRGPVLQYAKLAEHVNDGGSVLLTSSVAPYLGQAQGAIYAATKAADLALSRSWARDLAPRGIRVNSIAPGPIETNFFGGLGLDEDAKKQMTEQIKSQVPLGRFGSADEVAQVAVFLLSDHASYVTGSEYFVDGGITMR